ncbi:hypothetical protein [Sphingobacterium sp. DR205]|uniref:hypothetical protein n=1 Tax=Sphingobacterium sp. DR205 TaxID=2713573 RepID=UPI0013E42A96|nr:hypothetical protein [Sphingobacterium sp. DR205]QIH35459.1 hypothetical protein G6053_22420 [Sphingobacterium sp. DR205]
MTALNTNKPYTKIAFWAIFMLFGCGSKTKQQLSGARILHEVPANGTYWRNSDNTFLVAVVQELNAIYLYKISLTDSVHIVKFFGEKSNDTIFMDWRDYQEYPYNSKIGYIGGQIYPMWTIARKNKENPKNDIKGYFSVDEMLKDANLNPKIEQISNSDFSMILSRQLENKIIDFNKNQIVFDAKHLKSRKYNCNMSINYGDLDYTSDNPYGTINLFYNLTISSNGQVVKSDIDGMKNANQNTELLKDVADNLIGKKTQIYTILNLPVSTCIPCAVAIRFN